MTFLSAVSILALVAGSTTIQDTNEELTIADTEFRAQLFQQQLLMSGEHVQRNGQHNFAKKFMQSSRRRTGVVVCALDLGVVLDFLDITVSISPQNFLSQSCRLADQLTFTWKRHKYHLVKLRCRWCRRLWRCNIHCWCVPCSCVHNETPLASVCVYLQRRWRVPPRNVFSGRWR
jgi:hypothetical protein